MESKIVEVFKHRSRLCVIILMHFGMGLRPFHNGYVSVRPSNKELNYNGTGWDDKSAPINKITADELTFSGYLDKRGHKDIPKDTWFMGFDSAHSWNEDHPTSQSRASVKERAIKMADEMIANRI